MRGGTEPTRQELTPAENRPLYARFCDQTFAFSELARGLSSPANCLAFLPRSSLGWLFVGFPALQFTKKAFALKLLFQNPQCLIHIIVTNENFQSGFLSRLNKQVGYKTATPVRLGVLPSVHMGAFCWSALYMGLRSQLHKLEGGSEAAVAASHRASPISASSVAVYAPV
jgi:hypothetical protein